MDIENKHIRREMGYLFAKKLLLFSEYRKRCSFLFCIVLLGVLLVFPFANHSEASSLKELIDERTVNLWVEGQQLGDMVIGARAQLVFIYIDSKLMNKIKGDPDVPQWLSWHSQHYSDARKQKKGLFIVRFKTIKPWDFIPEMLSVAGYTIHANDIITRKAFRPEGAIPSDVTGSFAIMVPLSVLKKDVELSFTCDGFSQLWTVPR